MLVYFAALALMSLSLLEFGLYLAECHEHKSPVSVIHAGLLLVLFVLGAAILVRARAVARWVDNKLDE